MGPCLPAWGSAPAWQRVRIGLELGVGVRLGVELGVRVRRDEPCARLEARGSLAEELGG